MEPNLLERLEIRRELGQHDDNTLHLAYDPVVKQGVALRRYHFADHDDGRDSALLQRVRAVAQLRHPNLVGHLESGEKADSPYVLRHYIDGHNLGEFIAREGRLAPALAANLARQILDALVHAQAAGLIHGQLAPSNILIDLDGKLWLTDFALLSSASQKPSPYLPPEAGSRTQATPDWDTYAMGLILLEMLTAQPTTPATTTHGLQIPDDAVIDAPLLAILEKACRQNPVLRFQSAMEMKVLIDGYLGAAALPIGACLKEIENKQKGVLDAIINRMRTKADFPALSDSVEAINRLTNSDKGGISRLSTAILKDYGLTNKILRLVNSPIYRTAGGGSISTISRAVMVLGFDAVRNIVITAVLFDHLTDKANAQELKEAFLRASLAGALAREASKHMTARGLEESYICALFYSLGELLALYYFPEEVTEIRRLMTQKNYAEAQAAHHVLGITFADLGIGIARYWGFPQEILSSLRPLPEGVVRKSTTTEGMLHIVSGFANELRDSIAANPLENKKKILAAISRRFNNALPLSETQMQQVMVRALAELTDLATIMQVKLKQSPFANHLRGWVASQESAPIHRHESGAARLDDQALLDRLLETQAEETTSRSDKAQAILTAGIQDISNALIGDFALNDILRITLETMYRAMDFQRVILFVKDGRTNTMNGRFSVGERASDMARRFQFSLSSTTDVFQLAAHDGADILIDNVDDAHIKEKIPSWYRIACSARSFVLFPLNIKGKSAAMIYCDKESANSITLPEKELALLKTLRNQALLAIKQTI